MPSPLMGSDPCTTHHRGQTPVRLITGVRPQYDPSPGSDPSTTRHRGLTPRARSRCDVNCCRHFQYSFHGSLLSRARRSGNVASVKPCGFSDARSSSHVTGTLTGAPTRARVEYAAIDVFVRLLRR